MKALLRASAVVLVGISGTSAAMAPALAEPGSGPGAGATNPSPPFIEHTEWTQWRGLRSLRVFPTASGRKAPRQAATAAFADEAWAEVLALSPESDTAGMRAQFVCHWQFAELAEPGKTSWNLEPWRPVVDNAQMLATGCNPGGPEEAV
jgi:hypothetical protein